MPTSEASSWSTVSNGTKCRPDLVVYDKHQRRILVIEVGITNRTSLWHKEDVKEDKYKDWRDLACMQASVLQLTFAMVMDTMGEYGRDQASAREQYYSVDGGTMQDGHEIQQVDDDEVVLAVGQMQDEHGEEEEVEELEWLDDIDEPDAFEDDGQDVRFVRL